MLSLAQLSPSFYSIFLIVSDLRFISSMCAMQHSAVMGMIFDPRSGVVTVLKSIHLIMKNSDFANIKESVVRKLNFNLHKYYPDAGGMLMGYQGIKLKKSTSELPTANTSSHHPVHIRAKFFLFKPMVGSELECVVKEREDGLVTCLAHGVFTVLVVHPPKAWETVFVGQVVIVKVDAVEQFAWQEPKIAASLIEGGDFIDIVDNFDDDEVETITASGLFEYENKAAKLAQAVSTSHKVTEYFPIRRSERKPKAELLKEQMEGIEARLLANDDSNLGVEVAFIENKGRGIKVWV